MPEALIRLRSALCSDPSSPAVLFLLSDQVRWCPCDRFEELVTHACWRAHSVAISCDISIVRRQVFRCANISGKKQPTRTNCSLIEIWDSISFFAVCPLPESFMKTAVPIHIEIDEVYSKDPLPHPDLVRLVWRQVWNKQRNSCCNPQKLSS